MNTIQTFLHNNTGPSPMDSMSYLMNPLNLHVVIAAGVLLLKFIAEEALSFGIVAMLSLFSKSKLPSRVPKPIGLGLVKFEVKDYTFLFMNQFIELVFLLHLVNFSLKCVGEFEEFNVFNTVVVFYLTFLVDDFFYYFLHRFMHIPAVYPWIHKHHHRQALPKRGYLDAANETPLEQIGGLGCVWLTMQLLQPVFGYHFYTVFAFFAAYASLAILNHTPYDVELGFWGLKYNVKAHETHHRLLRCNYAQNTMVFDYLFGTYSAYPTRKTPAEDVKAE